MVDLLENHTQISCCWAYLKGFHLVFPAERVWKLQVSMDPNKNGGFNGDYW